MTFFEKNSSLCKLLSLILSVALIVNVMPIQSLFDVDVYAEGEATYTDTFDISSGSVSISEAGSYYITGTSTANTVTISGDAEINVTIEALNITSSSSAPIDITNTGTTTITLEGTNTLTQNSEYNACIQMSGDDDVDLIIEGDGTLTVNANNSTTNGGAGIGTAKVASDSAVNSVGGTITINSGTITVNHNGTGAAIGTGVNLKTDKIVVNNMTINITGGTITVSHRSGAGIGGGARMDGGTINISGGTITTSQTSDAKTDYCGAGIGGGTYYSASEAGGGAGIITITGGTLNCKETYAEGIGRGVLATSLATKTGTLIIDGDAVITAISIVGEDEESITSTWNATINGTVYSTVETFTVTFIDEDGTVSTKNVEQYTAMSEPTDLAKAGYKIEGYYTDNTYGTKFEFTTTITADTNIYVQWEVDTETIAYVDSLAELTSALTDTNKSLIVIQGNITLTSDITISHDVTIYSDGDYTIGTSNGSNFEIANGVNVVLGVENDENTSVLTMTLGDGSYSDPAIMVGTSSGSTATLIMYDGISIADDTGISTWGTFTMNGGEITGNTGKQFGGVYLQPYSTFIMNDGLIEGNCTQANGGGVAANGNGTGTTTVTLNGGTITGNTVSGTGDGYAIRVIGTTIKLNISENMVITTDVNTKNQFSWGGTETNISVSAKVTYDSGDVEDTVTDSTTYNYTTTAGYTATVSNGSTLSKTGYTFKEWNTQPDGSGTSYSSDATLTAYASITLYAIYEIDTYTVTYMNGDVEYLTEPVDYNNTVTKPADPTNTDSTQVFGGWYTDKDCTVGNVYDFDSQVTANITLYAKWLTGYTVTFVNADNNSTYDTQGIVKNETATDITNPTITGYTFVDWYSDEDYTTEFDFTTPITKDTTVYGKWTANEYTLSFDTDDTDDTSSITVTYDTEIGTLPTPTKENYDFEGWYIGDDEIISTTVWDYTESKEATAQWEKSNIQIVYNETELKAAITDTTVTDIVIGGSFTITEDITFNRSVTLYSNGDYTIDNGGSDYRFFISGSSTVNLGDKGSSGYTLTLTLGGDKVGVIVSSANATLNIYDGISISGSRGVGTSAAGTINMYGGTISDNSATSGGGVYLSVDNSTFNMYGGTITGNTATTSGGGVYITGTNSTFNMYGGEISGNSATSSGGGVYITGTNSTFNMYGGTITDNSADNGGGVYVNTGATFNMYGGEISYNSATSYGGGVYVTGGTFNMIANTIENEEYTGGTITHNTGRVGGGVFVQSSGTFTMDGGEISYNSSTGNGGGVAISSNTLTLKDGLIYENSSDSYGTAVRTSDSTAITISDDMLIYDSDTSDDDNLISITSTGAVSITATITYDSNGGTGTVANETNETVTELTEFTTEVPSADGLTAPDNTNADSECDLVFGGWNTEPDGSGTNYLPGETITYYASQTLYANWKEAKPYTLTLDTTYPDGSTGTKTVNVTFGSKISLTDPTFDDEDAEFKGYYIDGKLISDGDLWTYEENQTATSKWNLWYVYDDQTDGNHVNTYDLQTTIDKSESGDIIKIKDDLTLSTATTFYVNANQRATSITIDKGITIIGDKDDGSTPKLTFAIDVTSDNSMYNMFYMTAYGEMIVFDNLEISANETTTGSGINRVTIEIQTFFAGDQSNTTNDQNLLTIQNCIINSSSDSVTRHFGTANSAYVQEFNFLNNTVNGSADIILWILPTSTGTVNISGNNFNGTGGDALDIHLYQSADTENGGINATISQNVFDDYDVAIDIDGATNSTVKELGNWSIEYNIFYDVSYGLQISSDNDNYDYIALSNNYFASGTSVSADGIRMKVFDSDSGWFGLGSEYTYSTNSSNLVFDYYYKKNLIPTTKVDTTTITGFTFTTTGTETISSVSYTYNTDSFYYEIIFDDTVYYVTEDNKEIEGAGEFIEHTNGVIDIDDSWYGKSITVQKISLNTTLPDLDSYSSLNLYDTSYASNLLDSQIQTLSISLPFEVPNTDVNTDYITWISIVSISLALLIVKTMFKKRKGGVHYK